MASVSIAEYEKLGYTAAQSGAWGDIGEKGSGLRRGVTELLILGNGFLQIVRRQTQVLDAFAVLLEKVGIDVCRRVRRNDPFVSEVGVSLPGDIKIEPQRLAMISGILPRAG